VNQEGDIMWLYEENGKSAKIKSGLIKNLLYSHTYQALLICKRIDEQHNMEYLKVDKN
jgi:hypothetical protein